MHLSNSLQVRQKDLQFLQSQEHEKIQEFIKMVLRLPVKSLLICLSCSISFSSSYMIFLLVCNIKKSMLISRYTLFTSGCSFKKAFSSLNCCRYFFADAGAGESLISFCGEFWYSCFARDIWVSLSMQTGFFSSGSKGKVCFAWSRISFSLLQFHV